MKPSRLIVKGKISVRKKGSLLQLPRKMFRHKELIRIQLLSSMNYENEKRKGYFLNFPKKMDFLGHFSAPTLTAVFSGS